MKLEKDFLIKNIEGDFTYSIVEISGETRFNDDEKSKLIETNFKNVKAKLIIEIKDPILDEEERKYLSSVIRPFRNRIISITKVESSKYERINIIYINIQLTRKEIKLPLFEKDKMYKNLELNKEYSLKDLDL